MTAEAKIPASLEEETAIRRLDERTFAANLSPSFCIGAGKLTQCSHIHYHHMKANNLHHLSPQWRLRCLRLPACSKRISRTQEPHRHNHRPLGVSQPHHLRPGCSHRRGSKTRPLHLRAAHHALPGQSTIPSAMDLDGLAIRNAKVGESRRRISDKQEHCRRKRHQLAHGMVAAAAVAATG